MTGLTEAAMRLDAAVGAVRDAVDVLLVDPPADRWAGRAAGAAADSAAVLRGRGAALAGRAHDLADTVRSVAGVHPRAPVDPVDLRYAVADDRLTAALAVALDVPGAARGGGGGPDPVTVAAWWAGLDPAQREQLVRERPELVGGLDGVPAADRDRANRARLAGAEAAALAEQRAMWSRPLAGLGVPWNRVRTRLARLAALRVSLDGPDRSLLAFETDPDGDVRAAVAGGDVDTAGHVGVFTPGFTADVRDLGPRLDELEALRAAAGPDAAVVAWYDYDAPQWSGLADPAHSVMGAEAARVGGVRLAGFLEGIDAVRPASPPHLTALGHSYGTVTTAQALTAGADGVDDVVLLGSPGVPAGAAGAPSGHSWVAEAAGDPVADLGWFGPDPNRAPGMTGLSTREVVLPDGRVLDGVTGHEEYLRPGSTSAHGVAAVMGGRPDDVVLDRGIGAGDRLRRLLEPSR